MVMRCDFSKEIGQVSAGCQRRFLKLRQQGRWRGGSDSPPSALGRYKRTNISTQRCRFFQNRFKVRNGARRRSCYPGRMGQDHVTSTVFLRTPRALGQPREERQAGPDWRTSHKPLSRVPKMARSANPRHVSRTGPWSREGTENLVKSTRSLEFSE